MRTEQMLGHPRGARVALTVCRRAQQQSGASWGVLVSIQSAACFPTLHVFGETLV